MTRIVSRSSETVGANGMPPVPRWQETMREAVRDPVELCRLLRLPAAWEAAAVRGAGQFPVFAPRPYIAKMSPGDPGDPLLRQVLPMACETENVPGFAADPVGDKRALRAPGLIHKYPGRVLMVVTGTCAVHCRYCFRRHFPYSQTPRSAADWEPACKQIAADRTIHEVILSGGDPLTLVDLQLSRLVNRVAAVDHVRRLRVHTRLPIMIPERVNSELLQWMRGTRLSVVVVVHANHPAELDRPVGEALSRLVQAGIPVLNQAVLLRGINDRLETLRQLCLRLVDHGVMPYYLHQLDRVDGAAHFEVDAKKGKRLVRRLREQLPGYAVPRYVSEIPGERCKRVLA